MDNWIIWLSLVINFITLFVLISLWGYFKEYLDHYTRYVKKLEGFIDGFLYYVNNLAEQVEKKTEEKKEED